MEARSLEHQGHTQERRGASPACATASRSFWKTKSQMTVFWRKALLSGEKGFHPAFQGLTLGFQQPCSPGDNNAVSPRQEGSNHGEDRSQQLARTDVG